MLTYKTVRPLTNRQTARTSFELTNCNLQVTWRDTQCHSNWRNETGDLASTFDDAEVCPKLVRTPKFEFLT